MREYSVHGPEWIVEALKESKALEVDKEGVNVRRISELKEIDLADSEARSVYVVRLHFPTHSFR